MARAAAAAGARHLVHFSALGADAGGAAAYARSKAAGEAVTLEAFPGASILRPSVVFGPEDDFFNRFAALAAETVHVVLMEVYEGIKQWRPGGLCPCGAQNKYYFGAPSVSRFWRPLQRSTVSVNREYAVNLNY